MRYSTGTKTARMTATRDRINSGFLSLRAADGTTELAKVSLNATAGTVSGATLTLSGMPKTVSGLANGTIATAFLTSSTDAVEVDQFTIGIPGSGAQVIIDNGAGSLVVSIGQNVTVSTATITHG